MVTRARAKFEVVDRGEVRCFERRFESFQTETALIGIIRKKQRLDDAQSLLNRGMRAREV